MKRLPFKLYTHHHTHITLGRLHITKPVWRIFAPLQRLVVAICFGVGFAVLTFLQKGRSAVARQLQNTRQSVSLRSAILKSRDFARSLAVFVVLCGLGWAGFYSAGLLAKALELKSSVLGGTEDGIGHLNAAEQALAQEDLQLASSQFNLALASFLDSKKQLMEGDRVLAEVLNLLPQKKDAQNLLDAASAVSRAGKEMVTFYTAARQLRFSPEGLEADLGVEESLEVLGSTLDAATKYVAAANEKLSRVNPKSLPKSKQPEFVELSTKLVMAERAMKNFKDIFTILENLAVPRQNVLLVLQNNNELRPSGGFIGTYGSFVLEKGKIQNLKISSIYDLDGQLAERIAPPRPVTHVNTSWYLRDSNWFANFPLTAKKISSFYEKEGGETPDLVLAVTPQLIVELLKLTGPISVPTFGVKLDAENFIEQTQAISTVSDSLPENKPKQVLADFFPLLLQRLSEISEDKNIAVLEVLENMLESKQMVLYSRHGETQRLLEGFNWAGTIFATDRDYLAVVSSNLGGTKTDLQLQKHLSLKSQISADGSITNTVTLAVKNLLPDLALTHNTSFIRFFVPLGSTLVSENGFESKNLAGADSSFKQDGDVAAWEKTLSINGTSGTYTGVEAGKTFFGNWLTVKGGESKTVSLTYTLPYKLKSLDRHSLTLQKQLGEQNILFSYDVLFTGRELKWKNFETASLQANNLSAQTSLDKDKFFGLVLKSR